MAKLGLVPAALAFLSLSLPVLAQGVAPGGPIGGSTGIGSGLGGVVGGTGPTWPNATTVPMPPAPPPPGGHPIPTISAAPPPAFPITRPSSSAPPSREQFGSSRPIDLPSAAVPLALPARPAGDLTFLKGCWRTDVFRHGQHRGTTTWCLNDKGTGRFLYARINESNFFCHATAEAIWVAERLLLQVREPRCGDSSAVDTGNLECSGRDETTQCTLRPGEAVRLFRVR